MNDQLSTMLADSSRALADFTASMVYDKPSLMKALLEVAWTEKGPLGQRASRVVSICCCRFPEMLKPYVSEVIARLNTPISEGARRNFLKIFSEIDIWLKQKDKSVLLNSCFDYLTGSYPVSIKVYSMDILFRLSMDLPEIQREIYEIIEDQLPEASAGYKSRGMKMLKKIAKNQDAGFRSRLRENDEDR